MADSTTGQLLCHLPSIRCSPAGSHDSGAGRKGIDIAIEYRFEADPHFKTHQLLDDEIVALASPEYVEKHQLNSIEGLRGLTLIETERRLNSWKSILADFPGSGISRFYRWVTPACL
ncbi:LysR substrate-binding domain-containing protein [Oceanimonas sp. NS1]|nr:LysR substrate-binding domain-containing protein [Oceanimonas sp. NS1]